MTTKFTNQIKTNTITPSNEAITQDVGLDVALNRVQGQINAGVRGYLSNVSYSINEFVNYNGAIYKSLQNSNLGNTPPNTSFWSAIPLSDSPVIFTNGELSYSVKAGSTATSVKVEASSTAKIVPYQKIDALVSGVRVSTYAKTITEQTAPFLITNVSGNLPNLPSAMCAVGVTNNGFVVSTWENPNVTGDLAYTSNLGSTFTKIDTSLTFGDWLIRKFSYNGSSRTMAVGIDKIGFTDNGTTWTKSTSHNFGTSNLWSVKHLSGNAWLAGGVSSKIALSLDNGVTWESLITTPVASSIYRDIAYNATNNVVIVAGSNCALISTNFNGSTLSFSEIPFFVGKSTVNSAHYDSVTGRYWVSSGSNLYWSTDLTNWNDITSNITALLTLGTINAINTSSSGVLALGGANNVIFSVDNGQTFSLFSTGGTTYAPTQSIVINANNDMMLSGDSASDNLLGVSSIADPRLEQTLSNFKVSLSSTPTTLYKASDATISASDIYNQQGVALSNILPSIQQTAKVSATSYSLGSGVIYVLVAHTTTAPVIINLPTAQCINGRIVTIKDIGFNASVNNITIATDGPELIDGNATYTINTNKGYVSLVSDGTDWVTV